MINIDDTVIFNNNNIYFRLYSNIVCCYIRKLSLTKYKIKKITFILDATIRTIAIYN